MCCAQWVGKLSYQTQFCALRMCVFLCVWASLARRWTDSSPRESKCALPSIHHSLITQSLTYTQTRTYTHAEHVRECWYALIRALNTRLDASETHLSPCNCVETMLSAAANVCMWAAVNVSLQVSGQSNPLSNDWFLIWLTDRLPPPRCLLPAVSPFIIHFHFVSLSLPPAFLCSIDESLFLSILPLLFNVMFVLLFAPLHPS